MSTKRQKKKRITNQIRIGTNFHRSLKIAAAEEKTTISKLADEYLGSFIKPSKTYSRDVKKVV